MLTECEVTIYGLEEKAYLKGRCIMSSYAVELRNVLKIYEMGKVRVNALRGVNLSVRKGEFVVILGPSGCGKTTLLNIIGGVDRLTSGEVIVNGLKITDLSEEELTDFRRKNIGFVFQFFNLIPTLTAKENVMLGLELRGLPKAKIEEEALRLLSIVGLEDRANHFPSELSGGEQQRVAIARALAKDPQLLLCDEPTGELDEGSGKAVLSVLKKVNEEDKKTVILVTHNTVIGEIASRVIRLADGKIVSERFVENPMSVEKLSW